jgi:sugar phosphate isomerase/epimerase
MTFSRRDFVKGASFAVAAAAFAENAKPQRLPIAFSTLGCPEWDLPKILNFAEEHGFAAIELRGLQGNLDLPSHPAFAPNKIESTKKDFAAHNIKIACVSSSARMGEAEANKHDQEMSDGRRFVDLASALGAPYVRVFGDGTVAEKNAPPSDDLKARVATGLRELGTYAGPKNVTVILESHDNFTASATLMDVLRRANSPHAALLWDAHHTFATAKEDPETTVKQLGKWIRHTHLKDSIPAGNDRKYVLTGRGDVPIRRQITALQSIGYKGYYCFEWEKVWHPDLEAPEIAIADYAKVVPAYLTQARH